MFCVPKIPSIMMQTSQIMMSYIIVRRKENFFIEFQPLQPLIIINNVLLPLPQVFKFIQNYGINSGS